MNDKLLKRLDEVRTTLEDVENYLVHQREYIANNIKKVNIIDNLNKDMSINIDKILLQNEIDSEKVKDSINMLINNYKKRIKRGELVIKLSEITYKLSELEKKFDIYVSPTDENSIYVMNKDESKRDDSNDEIIDEINLLINEYNNIIKNGLE